LFENWRNVQQRKIFCQLRQIFAGGLSPGKKIERKAAEKDPPFGRFDIFQTRPGCAGRSPDILRRRVTKICKWNGQTCRAGCPVFC
jgi:hypothetical protein